MHKVFLLLILFTTSLCYANKKTSTNTSAITVYTAGDIADCSTEKLAAHSAATANLIQAGIEQNPSAIVLTLGDHTYPVGTPAEFKNCYEPTWGKFKNRTYPNPGNHEYYSPSAYAYFQYFGDAAGSQQKPYYSFNKGSWHIISLDSNIKKEQQQAQLKWLEEDLKNNSSSCILAVWHHPLFSSGLHGNNSMMKPAWEMLMAAKADLVLSSHDHIYERFALQNSIGEKDDAGMREFIVGTGGAKLMPTVWQKQNSEVLNAKVHGVLQLSLKKRSYEWQFLPVEGSTFTDKGSAVCHRK
jgi:hypothetical protein